MILVTKQKLRHRHREQTYEYKGEKGGWDELGDWGWCMYIYCGHYAENS